MIKNLLKTHFGYDSFRPLQEDIINTVLDQKDAVVLMPTGGGKSLCYQLPALALDGMTIVVSPLIALMKDQVDALKANGVAAESLTSAKSYQEIDAIKQQALLGQIKILYLAPERLAQRSFYEFLQSLKISLIAIDEAHCISEWGHEFRPDYRNLQTLRQCFPKVPLIALTATATPQVLEDIVNQLKLGEAARFVASFNRANLNYVVAPKTQVFSRLLRYLEKHQGESVIIYRFSRKNTEELARDLQAEGYQALPYHAGLTHDIRKKTQEKFSRDQVDIIVATIAFGMGIDKPDVRLIVHYELPKSIEGYYQETGRAGRDGLPSDCVLFYSSADTFKHRFFIDQMEDDRERDNAEQKLEEISLYAELDQCRRKSLLEYFGEEWSLENCQACDDCLSTKVEFDATEIAQKVLSAIVKTGQRFGVNHVVAVLLGSRSKRVLEFRHDNLSVHGIANDYSKEELSYIFKELIRKGVLVKDGGRYPTVALGKLGQEFLKHGQAIKLIKPPKEIRAISSQQQVDLDYDQELFAQLRNLRKQLADRSGVPPFVVFHDKALMEMSTYFPQSEESFYKISGVGRGKMEQFGKDFLTSIRSYADSHGLSEKTMPAGNKGATEVKKSLLQDPGSTYQKTKRLIEKKMSIEQVAKERGISPSTVIRHVEELRLGGESIDIEHLRPEEENFTKIQTAFAESGGTALSPVFQALGEQISYEQLKVARLFIGDINK